MAEAELRRSLDASLQQQGTGEEDEDDLDIDDATMDKPLSLVPGEHIAPVIPEDMYQIQQWLVEALNYLHNVTGFAWFGTIASFAIIFRISLLPIVRKQMLVGY
jgi:hypothetical protein